MGTRKLLILLNSAASLIAAAEPPLLRGVSPEFAKYYKSDETFSCISNPAVKLSFSRVNDDFCDCPDGSDEPGTSACAHLSPLSPQSPLDNVSTGEHKTSLALPGFYCKNKGHFSEYIPFTRVNDGICDYDACCDGSDEWEGVGGTKCEDRCKEIGKEWKKKEDQRLQAHANALKKRNDLVKEAAQRKVDLKKEVEELKAKVESLKQKHSALEREKRELERTEKYRSSQKKTNAQLLAEEAKYRIALFESELRNTLETQNSYARRLHRLEKLLSTFRTEYNPNFNDNGVKRAVQAWEDYETGVDLLSEDGDEDDVEVTSTLLNGGDPIDWTQYETVDDSGDASSIYNIQAYLPAPLRDWIDSQIYTVRVFLENNGVITGPEPNSEGESRRLRDKRDEVNRAETDLNSEQTKLNEAEEDITRDFGPDEIFRALKGKCTELDSGEYTYEVCWMKRVNQKSKKGGGQHSMGDFAKFETIVTDNELPADGKGIGSGERLALKYENGARCWNGPERSTTVVLACYENEEVWKVTEEEKCVYRIEAGTPAVCDPNATSSSGTGGKPKDEL